MSVVHVAPVAPVDPVDPVVLGPGVAVRLDTGSHTWRLSGVEFEDGVTTRCFECVACGAVRYSG